MRTLTVFSILLSIVFGLSSCNSTSGLSSTSAGNLGETRASSAIRQFLSTLGQPGRIVDLGEWLFLGYGRDMGRLLYWNALLVVIGWVVFYRERGMQTKRPGDAELYRGSIAVSGTALISSFRSSIWIRQISGSREMNDGLLASMPGSTKSSGISWFPSASQP